MRIRNLARLLYMLVLLISCTSCLAPKTFVQTMDSSWATIELRPEVTYDQAWETLVDTLVRRFDMEVLSKQDGYMRTSWIYTWTGTLNENYRVRITSKFSADRKSLDIKSEAEYGGPGRWVMGYDTRLLETIKGDIMGKLGRTTR